MKELLFDRVSSPVGEILLVVDEGHLVALDYAGYEERMHRLLRLRYADFSLQETPDPHGFSSRVKAYLAGDFTALDAIPVKTGGTEFQQVVWNALRDIAPGTTVTYGQLAAKVGKPKAARAVGMINSLNPVAIVLPCHRVVGSNATLTGYAGGLERKLWLLQHEGASLKTPAQARFSFD